MVDTSLSARSPTSSPRGPQSTFSAHSKDQALASLQLLVTSTLIPLGKRTIKWRADKGGEFTGDEVKGYCLGTGKTQEFTATNTPQQIAVSERVGRTLCGMVRCMLVDSRFPPFLLGELVMRASYLCNRIPHSALKMKTPYKILYGKDADLPHLRIIGARAFVHIKDANKLGHTSGEGMMCGFSQNESNSFCIWNPKTRRVLESRNVVFIETQPHLLPPSRRLSLLQDLEAPTFDFSDNGLDDKYSSHKNTI